MQRLPFPLIVAVIAWAVSACASSGPLTREVLTVSAPDRSWDIHVSVLSSAAGLCTFGPIQFSNKATEPRGGTVSILVTNETKTLTLGEAIASCATAFPGGLSQCATDQRVAYRCRGALITARPLNLR